MSTSFPFLVSPQLCNTTIDVFSSILCTKLRKMSYTIIIVSLCLLNSALVVVLKCLSLVSSFHQSKVVAAAMIVLF